MHAFPVRINFFPVRSWVDDVYKKEKIALCPFCGMDTVITDAGSYRLTDELIDEMHERWVEHLDETIQMDLSEYEIKRH